MNVEQFKQACAEYGLVLSEQQLALFEFYYKYLMIENEKMNLTAILSKEEVYEKHFFDSLLPSFVTIIKGKVLDIGSGAGFPGLVLKIAYPDLIVTLLDSNGKRINFLNNLINKMHLKNIVAIKGRAEEFTRQKKEKYDILIARAVAPLPILLEISISALKVGGNFIAMRGSRGEEDALLARNAAKILSLNEIEMKNIELNEGKRTFIIYRKDKRTGSRYPREYKEIKRQPL